MYVGMWSALHRLSKRSFCSRSCTLITARRRSRPLSPRLQATLKMSRGLMAHGTFIACFLCFCNMIYFVLTNDEWWLCRYGNWGVCFTYGTWFALGGLAAAGKTYNNCEAVRRGVGFLLKSQRGDGGWGESYLSCPKKVTFSL